MEMKMGQAAVLLLVFWLLSWHLRAVSATYVMVEFAEIPDSARIAAYEAEHGLSLRPMSEHQSSFLGDRTLLFEVTDVSRIRRGEIIPEIFSKSHGVTQAEIQEILPRSKRGSQEAINGVVYGYDRSYGDIFTARKMGGNSVGIEVDFRAIRYALLYQCSGNAEAMKSAVAMADCWKKHLDNVGGLYAEIKNRASRSTANRKRDADEFSVPSDPLYEQQWHLREGKDYVSLKAEAVWRRHGIYGHGVTVCVVDDGLDIHHPDIAPNYEERGSYDLNRGQPQPGSVQYPDYHGTRCAGEIAAAGWNGNCGIGVAPLASISAVRLLGGAQYDITEAMALSYGRDGINDIYSNSWGPDDDGITVGGPGPLAQRALLEGVVLGRRGLGSVFVFAAGNGRSNGDDCNYDGYVNSPYTIAVGAITREGSVPEYQEHCAAMLTVAPSSGGPAGTMITTTDINQKCTDQHTGTSAAAPLAAGVIALMLEANPVLKWYEIQDILARKAIPVEVAGKLQGVVNAAGLRFSPFHGFGRMSAWELVEASKTYQPLPALVSQTFTPFLEGPQFLGDGWTLLYFQWPSPSVNQSGVMPMTVFHVQVTVNIMHQHRGDLRFILNSPWTEVTLASRRERDYQTRGLPGWTFSTVAFWGENSRGVWRLKVEDLANPQYKGVLTGWSLTFYGIPEE